MFIFADPADGFPLAPLRPPSAGTIEVDRKKSWRAPSQGARGLIQIKHGAFLPTSTSRPPLSRRASEAIEERDRSSSN
jgi:hypothetical protein